MKWIYKYDETNKATHLTTIQVEDDHILAGDELESIPADFITPAKLVDGKIVSSTLEESDEYYGNTFEKPKPSTTDMQFSALSMQMAKQQQQIQSQNQVITKHDKQKQAQDLLIQSQNQMIAKLQDDIKELKGAK